MSNDNEITVTPAMLDALEKGCDVGKDGIARVDGVAISVDPAAGMTFTGKLTAKMSTVHSKTMYEPHPHSPEGRLDRLEETMQKLLALMVVGEAKQEDKTNTASLGVMAVMFEPKEEKPYPKRLQELLTEYETYMKEVREGDVYRCANPVLTATPSVKL